MTDPIQNFEFILKNNSKKCPLGLYSDNKQQDKLIYKPQDVISSVSKQLKAIQVADSLGINKHVCKDLQKYKKSNFISVNNLPVYIEVPKITTKFDTQCVSDTQLMNIIEDAEIIDVHRGMTQEFETTFVHHTEKHNLEDDEQSSENVGKEGTEKKHEPAVFSEKVIKNGETQNNKEYIEYKKKSITVNRIEPNIEAENSISLISPIICGNNIIETGNSFNCEASNNDENTQIEENIQVIHDCVEIEDDNDINKSIERPVSPIFMHINMKTKSKTPSPLIFNLERFEQFEKIAIPIIESNDLKTAKQVIDSQILDKELCFQIDEDIQLNHREVLSPVLQSKRETQEFKTHIVKDPNLGTDLEFIELDKATSDDLINRIMSDDSKSNSKRKAENEILKDEILFSSDEEDNYKIHKSYQDLPFTCALETSFYEQSDVLDKTMFVGFQTASNKSIQIFTESFAHAKSILSDTITVTNLVNNCDSSFKNKTGVDETQALGNEETEFSLAQKDFVLPLECNTDEMTHNIEAKIRSFEGFRTANNKEIKLSQKALARTKKVFQDIDLSDDFDTQIEDKNIERPVEIPVVSKTQHIEVNKNLVDDEIQNIDDEIIQEFENIEMSLPENKEPDKHIGNNEFIASSNKNTHISETGKFNDVIKDIDFDEDLIEVNIEETKMKENTLPLIIEDPNSIDIHLGGFEIASSKNLIISKEALVKTKTIFQDICTTESPNKSDKPFDKDYSNCIDIQQPSMSSAEFVGFKTANNKNIKISEQALAKVTNIFKDIDNTELPNENIKEKQTYMNEETLYFVGFKTANNKDIKISKDALAKTKNMFEGIDSSDFKLPMKRNTDSPKIYPEISECDKNFNKPSTSKVSFVGLKTASNKNVKISEAALAKTKYIFKDIDSVDVTFPEKDKNYDDEKIINGVRTINVTAVTAPAQPSFKGFQTANNKEIKISEKALAKTKDIFRDLNSDNYMYPEKLNKNSRESIEGNYLSSHAAEMIHFNMPSTSTTSFAGFKTANNKNINISKEALAKTKNIFKDVDATDFNLPDKVDSGLKIIKPVEKSVKTSKQNKNIETEGFNQPSISKADFIGFKTASNRKITISKESLAKTKNIFKDIDKTEFELPEYPIKDIHTADNITKKDSVSTFRYEIIDLNQPSTSKSSYVGFKTANNKKINISEESLAMSKKLFSNIDASDFTFKSKSEKEKIDGAKERKSPYPDLNNSEPIKFKTESGFKTANNKVINISEIDLARAKNLLQDLGSIEFQSIKQKKKDYADIEKDDLKSKVNSDKNLDNLETAIPKFQGFQTASNKTVKVSADALVKSKKLLEDIGVSQNLNIERKEMKTNNILEADKDYLHDDKIINNHIEDKNYDDLSGNGKASPVFKGFQTANKKPVKVSEEALARSRKLFEDIETIKDDPEPEFHGFKTGNDEEVELSQKTLADTKKLFEDVIKRSSFQGLQTASDKKVAIYHEALVKSRKVFQDLDKDEHLLINNEKKNSVIKFGFKTGSHREVLVSKEALARSKRRNSQIDNSNENIKSNKKNKATEHSISNIVDTQVLNNFEVSLHTEDFHDTQIKSKRSGSPILSCPRAKRRKKFETPYSQNLPTKVKKQEVLQTTNDTNKIPFTEDYKKNKKYTLKDLAELTKSNTIKIDPYILNFTFDNLLKFEFNHKRNELLTDNLTVPSLKQLFLNSVNNKLIPTGWLDNHLKLILWKLISYEVKFKILTATVKNVIDQLKYRYDKELYNAQRPALRKILEKDDVASKTLVLCVAGIYVDGVNVVSATTTNNLELLLTDGWYCIKATIDKMLAQLVCQGKIVVGSKIVTNGAELVNCEQGISPWEDTSAVRLKISGNSTRRARWDARLGYHAGAILSELSSVKLEGGKVSKLRVFVTRVYPALYVEKFEDGSTVTRSERLEHLHQMKSETERQVIMEKIYEEVEKEFSDEESQDSEGLTDSTSKRTCLDSGSQIAKLLKKSKDPAEFRACLTASQNRLLESHTVKHREHLLQNIQQKIRQKIENAGVCVNRSVVTLLKIRVAGVKGSGEVTKGMMSIWKPPEAVLEIIKEGAWIDVMNVVPTAIRYSEIQISAGRQSVFSASKSKEPENTKTYTNLLKRICYSIKDLSHNPFMATDYNEIDTVGFIFVIDPSIKEFDSTKQLFQNVFLADADKNMICINFWGGLKKFGYENVLDTGQIVYCANLQKRAGNTRKSIPQYRVTEFSYFTKMPKNENARILVEDLSKKYLSLDRRKFCEDCVVLKNNYAIIKLNTENISPYRFNNSDFNISKNKMLINSPLARTNRKDDNFNLTGLDFESTFKQTDTQNMSEEVLQRKRKVNEKIAKLKMYGEPPPLSTIHIINRSKNASSSYKSPLNSSSKMLSENARLGNDMSKYDSSVNVASVKETPDKCQNSDIMCSPILMNKTFVKYVNPVKIDFDMKDNNDSNLDHFPEEFDGSPPLSLD